MMNSARSVCTIVECRIRLAPDSKSMTDTRACAPDLVSDANGRGSETDACPTPHRAVQYDPATPMSVRALEVSEFGVVIWL